MTLAIFLLVALALTLSTPAQTTLAFEVASVRPSKAGSPQRSNFPLDSGNVYAIIGSDEARTAAGGYLVATHQPLWRYISFAYKLSGTQELALRFSIFSGVPRSGAPFWVTGSFNASPEFFDISARAPADTSIDRLRLMMRALLADRFHLVTHYTSADAPVFALVLAKPGVTGPKLQPHPSSDSCVAAVPEQSSAASAHPATATGDLPPVCGVVAHVSSPDPGQHYGARAVPLSLFATSLPTMTGLAVISRPVVDATGLAGLYDLSLTWIHDMAGGDASVSENAASFRDALKAQLGLELRSAHAPISFLMIDRVERPSEN